MIVNNLRLPDAFLRVVGSGALKREVGSWQLRSSCDAFGQYLETEIAEVYDTATKIERETAELPIGFEPNEVYGESRSETAGPGAIPDIVDFDGVLCIGMSGDGAPFCLDYRGGEGEPCVIWWDDVYWRVVAPDFASFLSLFDLQYAEPGATADRPRE